jgi:hypothetical protein
LSRRARLGSIVLLATAVGIAGCSGGGSDADAGTVPRRRVSLEVSAGPVAVEAAGTTAGTLSDQDRDAVVDVVRRYVTAGTIAPLEGKPVGDLAPLFSTAAAPGLVGPDRAALVDEGLPEATGRATATAAPLAITALSDSAGAIDLVGTALTLDVAAKTAAGPVAVKRAGELVLTRTPEGWKIDSYRLLVTRDGAGLGPATPPSSAATGP